MARLIRVNVKGFQVIHSPGVEGLPVICLLGQKEAKLGASQCGVLYLDAIVVVGGIGTVWGENWLCGEHLGTY